MIPKKILQTLEQLNISDVVDGYMSRSSRGMALFTCKTKDDKVKCVLGRKNKQWVVMYPEELEFRKLFESDEQFKLRVNSMTKYKDYVCGIIKER